MVLAGKKIQVQLVLVVAVWTWDLLRMIKPNLIGQAIEKFLENYDENEAYLKSQRELRADCEARHKRLEDLKKQALTNENNFDCEGCA